LPQAKQDIQQAQNESHKSNEKLEIWKKSFHDEQAKQFGEKQKQTKKLIENSKSPKQLTSSEISNLDRLKRAMKKQISKLKAEVQSIEKLK
jgi:hypothetical protein